MASRVYTIKMSWDSNPAPIVVDTTTTYKEAKRFLDNLQKAWKGRGLKAVRVAHDRLEVNKFAVWFEQEKQQS